ncbi:hypothetical protein GCM10023177_02630 [Streptomyces violaceoruber]|nr:hypothetical protein JCM4020_02890 [Streptomyces coelicolor]
MGRSRPGSGDRGPAGLGSGPRVEGRHTAVPARFRTDPWLTAALVVSSAAILCSGAYGVLKTVAAVADPRVADVAVDVAVPDTASLVRPVRPGTLSG